MGTGSFNKSDLPHIFHYSQISGIEYILSSIVHFLREFFADDSYYHVVFDQWGFPKTPDETGLDFDAGINDSTTTRLLIGQQNRKNVVFYPAIIVKMSSLKSVPISFNRNKYFINYETITYQNEQGETKLVQRPANYESAGAFNSSVSITIQTRSLQSRQDLVDLVSIFFIDTKFEDMVNSGITILDVSVGGFTESDDRNEKLFQATIDLSIRSEWRKTIPIFSVIDIINFCIEFGDTLKDPFVPDDNLTIQTQVELLDKLNSL